jgi:hypothetical protein
MNTELSDTDRRHAADRLGVPADVSPTDARAAFLRKLPAIGFLPAPSLCAAAASLAGQAVPGSVGVIDDSTDDDALRSDVATFARQFWSLPPEVRRERWQALVDRAALDPPLTGRLRRLELGLDLRDATGVPGPPRQREVVDMIQSLFVLGPIERAMRRREMLDGLPPPVAGWEKAARRLQNDLPAHAALEPALVERLSTWTRHIAVAAKEVGRVAPTWGFQTQGGLQMPPVPQVQRPARTVSNGQRVPVWLLAALVIGGLRALLSGGPSASQSYLSQPIEPPSRRQLTTPAPTYRPVAPPTTAPEFSHEWWEQKEKQPLLPLAPIVPQPKTIAPPDLPRSPP